jgi:hypothetical protein
MILKWEQIQNIVKNNPNKAVMETARSQATKLQLHVDGVGMETAIKKVDYFSNDDIHGVQKKDAVSNVDFFARLLQQEDLVFQARGGSSYFRLPDSEEAEMNAILSNIEHGMNLRKWVKTFALSAFRTDPMGIIFMEIEPASVDQNGTFSFFRCYPTYKSSHCIFDYQTTGRKLEYVCFSLSVEECLDFGIQDDSLKNTTEQKTKFFRIVDDAKDLIVQLSEGAVSIVTNISQQNPIANFWGRTPGFVISDIVQYKNPKLFLSPVQPVIELAECYLQDRSIRDLQKKYHGFAKAIEPLLSCSTCLGSKWVGSEPCPDCTPKGGEPTGYKIKTKIGDVARFPLEILDKGSFDFNKIFGYVSPDIKGWEKQDASLEDLEELAEMTYWGTIRMKRPKPGPGATGDAVTATEVNSNEAPKQTRLNFIADWAEKTETLISNFIGSYYFPNKFKQASISYGRDYILKTPEELMAAYQTLVTKGAPDFSKDEALEKYYQAKYQNNPVQLQKFLKMLNVEPFPHDAVSSIEGSQVIPFEDKLAKRYCGEWMDTVPEIDWIRKTALDLKTALAEYVKAKNIPNPAPVDPTKVKQNQMN